MNTKDALPKGIIYLSNLPHGFYEPTLRRFFTQFGEISRLKVKRSDKNAKPMGYAYIEFAHRKVARVVANTMHNYLLFNKLLKCKLVDGGDSDKIFRKSNLKVEFCSGTKRKRKNQLKLENVSEEKVLKKVKRSEARLSKALGLKIDSRFLVQNSKNEDSENKDSDLSEEGELTKKSVFVKGKRSSQDTNSVTKKKLKLRKSSTKMENSSTTTETPNVQLKTPQKKKGDKMGNFQTPLYMDIEDEDDEIQIKTPPNVIKRYKKSTKIGSLKKKILGSNKSSIKRKDATSSSNDAKEAKRTDLKKRKRTPMKIKDKGDILKPGSKSKSDHKIIKKNSMKKKDLKAKKCNDDGQSNDQSTESVSAKVIGKYVKLKRNAESMADKQAKKLKLSSKKIKKIRNPKSKPQEIKLLSFKKKTVET